MHGVYLILFVKAERLIGRALLNRIRNTCLELLLLHGSAQGCVTRVEGEG